MIRRFLTSVSALAFVAGVGGCLGGPQTDPPGDRATVVGDAGGEHRTADSDGGPFDGLLGPPTADAGAAGAPGDAGMYDPGFAASDNTPSARTAPQFPPKIVPRLCPPRKPYAGATDSVCN